jgi:hypothetical protein
MPDNQLLISALRNNVVPAQSRIINTSAIAELVAGDPDFVNLFSAASRFSSVIEIADTHCLRVADKQLNPDDMLFPFDTDLFQKIIDGGDSFTSYALSHFNFDSVIPAALKIELIPESLQYEPNHKVKIVYNLYFRLSYELRPPPTPGQVNQMPPGGWPEEIFLSRLYNPVSPGAPYIMPMYNTLSYNKQYAASYRFGDRFEGIKGVYEPDTTYIGTCKLIIEATYQKQLHAGPKQVDVWANIRTATFSFELPVNSDVEKLYNADFFDADGGNITSRLRQKGEIKLVPTISCTGTNNFSAPDFTELPNFDVAVFPVDNSVLKLQALAIAINGKHGCVGIIEDVQHFIGGNAYGVISDEFFIDKVFRYKWRNGGFLRRLQLEKNITIKRNGHDENATMVGTLTLQSLDVIAVEVNSNTRRDDIRLAGRADAKADRIILNDGSVVDQHTPNAGLDFGNIQHTQWSISTQQQLVYQPSSTLTIRQFEQRARMDAYRHLARPFAHYDDYQTRLVYTRTEGVSKQVFYLGDIPFLFL